MITDSWTRLRTLWILSLLAVLNSPVDAADKFWIGGTSLWQNGTWTGTAGGTVAVSAPGAGDNVFIFSGNDIAVTRDALTGDGTYNGVFQLDGTGGASVLLDKTSTNSLTIGTLTIGVTGRASFNVAGGNITSPHILNIGSQSGSSGSMSFANGNLSFATSDGQLVIGNAGTGWVNQDAGHLLVPTSIILGSAATGQGSYTINGGSLEVGASTAANSIGLAGAGLLVINGGTASLNVLNIGSSGGGRGTVSINGGTLLSNKTVLGSSTGSGVGTVIINSGTASFGSLTINPGSSLVNLGGQMSIGSTTIVNGGTLDMGSSSYTLTSTSSLTVTGGYFAAAAINNANNLAMTFNSGTVSIGSGLNPLSNALFGGTTLTLSSAKMLAVGGTTTISLLAPIVLSGGTFSTGSLAGNLAAFQFNLGTYRQTGTDLTIGSSGPLGATFTLDPNRRLEVGGGFSAVIDSSGQLYISGGALDSSASVINNGLLQLSSPVARISAATLNNSGLVSGTGRIQARLLNQPAGEVRLNPSDQLRFESVSHVNDGLINLSGGALEFTGSLLNSPSGRITGHGVLSATTLLNSNDIAISTGATDIHGDVSNSSTGKIIISGGATVSFWDDVTNNAGGTIKVSTGSSATFFGAYAGIGITGGGIVRFEDDITPGFSPAAITLAADVSFGGASRLNIELGGTTRGSQYDAVDVTGAATLDGTLHLSRLNNFVPAPGTIFDILHYSSRSGSFQILNQTGWDGLQIIPLYGADSLRLSIGGLIGDANFDGIVNGADLYQLATHWMTAGDWSTGDFDGSGFIDAHDLGLLSLHWQESIFAPPLGESIAPSGSNVPEPCLCGVLSVAGTLALRRRRRFHVSVDTL